MHNKLSILFIDDDTIEIMKLRRTILTLGLKHKITGARNGKEAHEILMEKDKLPDIILLDLNMPKINGLEFLSLIKTNDTLKHIPTIILSTSRNQKDIIESYKIGIAGYILKPLRYEDYVSKIDKILSYWSINVLINN